MTTGKPITRILLFALPCIAGNILQNLFPMIDTVLMGQAGDISGLAAVGVTSALISLFQNTGIGMMTGFSIAAAHRFGAKDEEGVRQVYTNAMLLTVGFGIAASIAGVLTAKQMLLAINTPENLLRDSTLYFRVFMIGMLPNLLCNFLCEMLRAVGNSKAPLFFLCISSIIHIVLIYLFLFVFKLGIAGAALSSVLSHAAAWLMCAVYVHLHVPLFRVSRLKRKTVKVSVVRECLKLGLPMAATNFVVMFGVMLLSYVTNGIGEKYAAAYSIASKIGYILTAPVFGFSSALAVFAAQNRENRTRIREGVCCTVKAVTLVNAALLILFVCAGSHVLKRLLLNDETAVNAAGIYLMIRCVAMFVLTFASCFKSVLNAVGKPAFPTFSGFVEIGIRYLTPVLFSGTLGFLCVPMTDAFTWVILAIFLFVGYWKELIQQTKEKKDEKCIL